MADARRGIFDVVLVFRFDRFARSVKQMVLALEEFRSLGVDFISYQESLDTCAERSQVSPLAGRGPSSGGMRPESCVTKVLVGGKSRASLA